MQSSTETEKKRRRGRPRTVREPTSWEIEAVLRLIAESGSTTKACAALGLKPITVNTWRLRDPDFHARLQGARDSYRTTKTTLVAQSIRAGGTLKDACLLAGVNIETVYKWRRDRPEIQKILEAAVAERASA